MYTQLRTVAVSAAACIGLCFVQPAVALPASDGCSLPRDLRLEITAKYPGARVVNLKDLLVDDRKFFQSDHGKACPGLIKLDFYGDGKPTLALVLITKNGAKDNTQLVVTHEVEAKWRITPLDTGGPIAPVVWGQPPGKYTDVYGNKTVRARQPVIVFCKYEAWAILYAWTGKGVSKIWIMD